jgi:hypothetical protein
LAYLSTPSSLFAARRRNPAHFGRPGRCGRVVGPARPNPSFASTEESGAARFSRNKAQAGSQCVSGFVPETGPHQPPALAL